MENKKDCTGRDKGLFLSVQFNVVELLLLLFSRSVMSNFLPPHGLQHTRLPYPSPSPRVCPSSCPLNQCCHPTISSSVAHFSFWRDSVQFSSVAQSCLTLCDPMNCSTPGLPVHHQLPESTQTHVHWVGDAIQPSHPLSSPSPPALKWRQKDIG